jgi:sialate O-acetylesterase
LVNEKGVRFESNAAIKNNHVVIAIPTGEKIQKVLYAWQPFTRANLCNEAGLPDSTFSVTIEN